MTDGAQRQTKSNGTAAAPRNRRERGATGAEYGYRHKGRKSAAKSQPPQCRSNRPGPERRGADKRKEQDKPTR